MMNEDEIAKAAKRATDKFTQQQNQTARTADSSNQLTTGAGLKVVRNNWLPPSAAHQPMKYEPVE